ncbi:MAG TPA: DNA-processing protein DprA [Candidatus Tripitaka californicus]|uniref:DNA-processing protein DprA n=1 Tax=Candidatus Tripitaka californicus TaxID=3367616 RepID=UPI004029A48B|nr:DNA-processing protein DprA [Planctomycetota bacterium]
MDDPLYWIALHGVEGVGPATFRLILDRFPGPKAAMEAPRRELISVRGLSDSVIRGIVQGRGRLEDTKRLLKILNKNGISVIIRGEEDYPAPLKEMKNSPVVLYARGRYLIPNSECGMRSAEFKNSQFRIPNSARPQVDERAVAIVGTTRPTEKGLWIARESARRLVEMGYTIVSGYARGIDTAAHLGALEAGGRTILALPTGILRFLWRGEFKPYIKSTDAYLILSDSFPTEGWHVGAAMSRNRLIACLSRAVLVVETEVGGGAIYTAEFARGLGRKIFTLRYRNTPPTARGNQLLLERGAIPLTNFKELEECVTNLL